MRKICHYNHFKSHLGTAGVPPAFISSDNSALVFAEGKRTFRIFQSRQNPERGLQAASLSNWNNTSQRRSGPNSTLRAALELIDPADEFDTPASARKLGPFMFLGLFRVAVACALIFAIGGHWAFLQSIVWTGMVISYVKTAPLKEALEKTFDGNHPCALCKVVAEGKKSEKRHESHKLETKLDFLCCAPALPFAALLRFGIAGVTSQFLPERIYTPPTPPPELPNLINE